MSGAPADSVLEALAEVLEARKDASADSSYVASLFTRGTDAILKKVGEEATELVIAGKGDDDGALVHETADLWFHCLVMLSYYGLSPDDVLEELRRREGISGIEEKKSRRLSD